MTVPIRKGLLQSPTTRGLVYSLLLVLATLALYYPVHRYPFVDYDDDTYVTDNWHIKYGFDHDTLKWAFTSFYADNWHPLTWLSHALDCQFFFLNPGRHHETNLLLQAANAVLLFWVLLRATGYEGRSFMVAALFALHPLNVESVAWISERKNLLSMLFFLLALGAYRWYAREPRVGRYALVALLFALGLMAKPQVITFPFVLLLWDYWPLRRMFATRGDVSAGRPVAAKSFSWLVLEKLPLFALAGASAFVTLHAEHSATMSYPFAVRIANAVVSYLWYMEKLFWPSGLAILYPHPLGLPPAWQVVLACLCLLAITALVIAERRRRYLLVGWFWFLGTLVPMIGLVQVGRQAMADRYAYLPCIGLFLLVSWLVADWSERWHMAPASLEVASFAVILALAFVAHRQIGYWRSSFALWSRSLQVTHANNEAENNLGVLLMSAGRVQEALPHLQAAVALSPLSVINNVNLGMCEQRLGKLQSAIEHYNAALKLSQNDIPNTVKWRYQVFTNLSVAYRDLGNYAAEHESYEAAQELLRKYAKPH